MQEQDVADLVRWMEDQIEQAWAEADRIVIDVRKIERRYHYLLTGWFALGVFITNLVWIILS